MVLSWVMEYLFRGSHIHRTTCFLSFLCCNPFEILIIIFINIFVFSFQILDSLRLCMLDVSVTALIQSLLTCSISLVDVPLKISLVGEIFLIPFSDPICRHPCRFARSLEYQQVSGAL